MGSFFCHDLPGLGTIVIADSTVAQAVKVQEAWREVYKQLPDFPKENQYVSRKTGEIDPNNTLVGRLIYYHVYLKVRPAYLRLDWKLTLADYLGVNEIMQDSLYPGADVLSKNPIDQDRKAIRSLSRVQREALVEVLVKILSSAPRRV